MNALNNDQSQSETNSSAEDLESIVLDALLAPEAMPSHELAIQDPRVILGKHPNIVLLADAQLVEPSQPGEAAQLYSERIDDHCDRRRLEIATRLKLLAQVCRAVHFAHQHAVIHGHLNPSNIVVTSDGVPKVTGFELARVVHPETPAEDDGSGGDAASETATEAGEMISPLEFTSPEQLNGEPVTTASDIYALGAVLYRLLTGRSPYRFRSTTRSDVIQAIFEQAPEKPSSAVIRRDGGRTDLPAATQPALAAAGPGDRRVHSDSHLSASPSISTPQAIATARGCSPKRLSRILSGDIDAIVLMALRKEPDRRYGSADQLADDLDRYLKGMPVRADGRWNLYHCGRFVLRHTVLVTIVLLAFGGLLIAGAAAANRFIAAPKQRDRAQEFFPETQEIVDRLFARISHERLLKQPAYEHLRAALLADAERFYRDYLEQHRRDGTPQPTVIDAHSRLARIASLTGATSEAVSEYRQAAVLWEQLATEQPSNRRYREKLANALGDLGVALMPPGGQLDQAGGTLRRARELIDPLLAAEPGSVSLREKLGEILLNLAQIRAQEEQPDEALQLLESSERIELQLASENPRSVEPRIHLATAFATAGRILAAEPSELPRAIASYQEASGIYQTIVQEHPELADQAYQYALNLNELSGLQERTGQLDLAFQNRSRSLIVLERINELNPDFLLYQRSLGSVYNVMAGLERKRAESADSLAFAQKARAMYERLVADHPRDLDLHIDLAETYSNLGRHFEQAGEPERALRALQHAVDLYEGLPKLEPQNAYSLACNISRCIPLFDTKNRTTAGQATSEPKNGDRLRRRLYGDRAVAALRQAARTGRFTAEALETDKDLEPLHDRSDFKDLIKELENKAAAAGS